MLDIGDVVAALVPGDTAGLWGPVHGYAEGPGSYAPVVGVPPLHPPVVVAEGDPVQLVDAVGDPRRALALVEVPGVGNADVSAIGALWGVGVGVAVLLVGGHRPACPGPGAFGHAR